MWVCMSGKCAFWYVCLHVFAWQRYDLVGASSAARDGSFVSQEARTRARAFQETFDQEEDVNSVKTPLRVRPNVRDLILWLQL